MKPALNEMNKLCCLGSKSRYTWRTRLQTWRENLFIPSNFILYTYNLIWRMLLFQSNTNSPLKFHYETGKSSLWACHPCRTRSVLQFWCIYSSFIPKYMLTNHLPCIECDMEVNLFPNILDNTEEIWRSQSGLRYTCPSPRDLYITWPGMCTQGPMFAGNWRRNGIPEVQDLVQGLTASKDKKWCDWGEKNTPIG
jgi:hypothetical protein